MSNAADIHGQVFREGSATLLARVVGGDGSTIVRADIASAQYTVYLLDENDPDARTPIAGHANVAVAVGDLIFDALQTDDLWTVDSTGYNFRHTLDVSGNEAFAVAGKHYRVVFELTPVAGQMILIRFRVHAI